MPVHEIHQRKRFLIFYICVYCDHHNVAVTKKGTQRLKNSRKEIYCDLDRYFVIIFE